MLSFGSVIFDTSNGLVLVSAGPISGASTTQSWDFGKLVLKFLGKKQFLFLFLVCQSPLKYPLLHIIIFKFVHECYCTQSSRMYYSDKAKKIYTKQVHVVSGHASLALM